MTEHYFEIAYSIGEPFFAEDILTARYIAINAGVAYQKFVRDYGNGCVKVWGIEICGKREMTKKEKILSAIKEEAKR